MRMENPMKESDDWRLRGQEGYLQNKVFQYKKFIGMPDESLHAHCEFCWHKFMENPAGLKDCSSEGYRSTDGIYWICKECFEDFKERLHLRETDRNEI